MAPPQATDASTAPTAPTTGAKAAKSISKPQDAAAHDKLPPPETKESLWLRRWVIVSFWAVAVLLGLPVWWRTTAIYRAELPLQAMSAWADGTMCRPVFPLRIAVEAPASVPHIDQVLRAAQHALDDTNEFPAHHLRLLPTDPPTTANTSQQVTVDGSSHIGDNEEVALTVRLIQVETGETPRSHLHPYAPAVDIYYTAYQLSPSSTTGSPLATFLAHELHKIFEEEQAQLSYLLAKAPNTHASKFKPLAPEKSDELRRQSTRVLKYAPTYHLTFSLFTPTFTPSAWDIEAALKQYLTPLLESFSSVSNFTIDTQVQLYATFSPSIRQPEFDEEKKAWTLRKEDLSGFINAAEWPLSPSIGEGPTVNFALYVPEQSQLPLLVKENGASSWLVPQWGGVAVLNRAPADDTAFLTKDALAPVMQTFSNQLISLLGLPQAPTSLPLRLSTLTRVRAASLVFSASSTLGALAQVYQKMPSIPVPDSVSQSVSLTLTHLQHACDQLREGHFQQALEHARIAEAQAEKAFFERSMVGQVYFPDEHKVAVYLPLLGPVAVPLIMAALKEIKGAAATRKRR